MEANAKLMSMTDAVKKYVHDGAVISFGGFSATQCPMAAAHEIIRQGVKDLHVVVCSNGQAVDELVGAGCVAGIELAYGGNGRFASTCFRFRSAAQSGELKVEDYSNYHMTLRFMAGAMGMPFLPTYSGLGTDIVKKWRYGEEDRRHDPRLPVKKLVLMGNPFNRNGGGEQVLLVPALMPDVTIIHAQKADVLGNARITGLIYADVEQAKAAKNLIITCEEIVETDELRKDPELNQILGFQVSAVVKVPWGSYPCAVYGCYDYDPWFLRDFYPKVAKDDSEWRKYLDAYVYGVANREEFLNLIGMERVERLRADKTIGYNPVLNRS